MTIPVVTIKEEMVAIEENTAAITEEVAMTGNMTGPVVKAAKEIGACSEEITVVAVAVDSMREEEVVVIEEDHANTIRGCKSEALPSMMVLTSSRLRKLCRQ